jgi:threonine synthase
MNARETRFCCARCGAEVAADPRVWRCSCGGPFELAAGQFYEPADPLRLGEGHTPLVPAEFDGRRLLLKSDQLNPTGSYKDRGAGVMIAWLREWGVTSVAEDSSGNAGCAVAGYAAAAGMKVKIFTPASNSPGKSVQMRAYGAEVVPVPGPRMESFHALMREVEATDLVYASHNWNPLFIQGLETSAVEILEQLGRAPDWVFAPCGFGTIYLGLARGFLRMQEAGRIERAPRVVGIQAANCAPVFAAFEAGKDEAEPIESPGETAAEGIAASAPMRSAAVLEACRKTQGKILAVSEDEILKAHEDLSRAGFYVEKTSAVVLAGFRQLSGEIEAGEAVVLFLTGHGLKAGAE